MRPWISFLLTLAVLIGTLSGCGSAPNQVLVAEALTPEEAVRRALTLHGQFDLPQSFQVIETRELPGEHERVLILYRTLGPLGAQTPSVPTVGFQLVERQADGWHAMGGAALARTASPAQPVEYMHTIHHYGGESYVTVFGFVVTPEAATVEVTFDNGQTLHAMVDAELFALATANAHIARQLRVLDRSGRLLWEAEPPAPMEVG